MGRQCWIHVFKKILCSLKKYFLMPILVVILGMTEKLVLWFWLFPFFQDEEPVLIFWHKLKMGYSEKTVN